MLRTYDQIFDQTFNNAPKFQIRSLCLFKHKRKNIFCSQLLNICFFFLSAEFNIIKLSLTYVFLTL